MNQELVASQVKPSEDPNDPNGKNERIIAHRRSCDPEGTGLTHFILPAEKKA